MRDERVTSSLTETLRILETIEKDEEHNMIYSQYYDVNALVHAINTSKIIIAARIARSKP